MPSGSDGTSPPHPPSLPSVVEAAVRAREDLIRRDLDETLCAFDLSGVLVFSKAGSGAEVHLTDAELRAMRGTVATHNHPLGLAFPEGDPRGEGSAFSPQDIEAACLSELVETRAVTPTWRYRMSPPPDGWDERYWRRVLRRSYLFHEAAVRSEFLHSIRAGQIRIEQAEAAHWHEVWTRVAQELRLGYTRERG